MTQLILFDRPPTLLECEQSTRFPALPQDAASTWIELGSTSLSVEEQLLHSLSMPQTALPNQWDPRAISGTDGADESLEVDESNEDSFRYQMAGAAAVMDKSIAIDGVTVPSDCFYVLPGPMSTFDSTRHYSQDFFATPATQQNSYAATQGIGAPPNFAWNPQLITKLSKLYDLAKTSSGRSKYEAKVSVDILAAIDRIEQPKQLPSGYLISKWTLKDPSGASIQVVMWGSIGVRWTGDVRKGDVVHIHGLGIAFNSYDGALTGSIAQQSILQVCYRTRFETEDDAAYSFNHQWATVLDTARSVCEVVEWLERRG